MASKIESDDGVFERLTDTIIRQVGDLRRMVDEFSSFARMPKPVFREESLLDLVAPGGVPARGRASRHRLHARRAPISRGRWCATAASSARR